MENLSDGFTSDINFVLQTKFALFSINRKRTTEYNYLKPKQVDCVKDALSADTLVILPTGYGKSLIYEVIQKITDTKIIVISPINAIINEQKNRFGESAFCIEGDIIRQLQRNSDSEEVKKFKKGNVDFLLGHPESFLEKSICDVLTTGFWTKVSHIFVDESHCVVSWGHDFRPAFEKISRLRSIFPSAIMVAMTATATLLMQKEIQSKLLMRSAKVISSNPNRDNLKLVVKKRSATVGSKTDVEDAICELIKPFVKELCELKQQCQKTIIYSNLKTCGIGYEAVKREALKYPNTDEIMECVSQYHAPSTDKKKKQVAAVMRRPEGQVRLLFATEAYGMGADAPDIRQIIHIGPPNSMESYLQEIGRAGRDGKRSQATLFYNASDIGTNRKHLKKEMSDFCKTASCRREYICHYFGYEVPKMDKETLHFCCDSCEKVCECQCCSHLLAKLVTETEVEEVQQKTSQLTVKDIKKSKKLSTALKLDAALKAYFSIENMNSDGSIHTGLTCEMRKTVVNEHEMFKSENDLKSRFQHLNCIYTTHIYDIIRNIGSV